MNMVLRMLMRARRQNARKGKGGGNPNGRKLRSVLSITRIFGRF